MVICSDKQYSATVCTMQFLDLLVPKLEHITGVVSLLQVERCSSIWRNNSVSLLIFGVAGRPHKRIYAAPAWPRGYRKPAWECKIGAT